MLEAEAAVDGGGDDGWAVAVTVTGAAGEVVEPPHAATTAGAATTTAATARRRAILPQPLVLCLVTRISNPFVVATAETARRSPPRSREDASSAKHSEQEDEIVPRVDRVPEFGRHVVQHSRPRLVLLPRQGTVPVPLTTWIAAATLAVCSESSCPAASANRMILW